MSATPANGDEPTRDRLVRLLRYRSQTIEELAGAVALTPNGVRAHLTALERDGLVKRVGVRHAGTPGKPAQLYAVTAEAEARRSVAYGPVLTGLVATLSERLASEELHAAFSATGRRLVGHRAGPVGGDVADAAKTVLESLGAAATVRRRGGRVTVEGAACPLADAVRRCPGSCEMVRAMLAATTGARVTTRCEHGDAPRCRFTVS
ncbi:MAG: helix-turn-helix transcriptional regulator [Gemmatimonadales bacterium]